MFWDSIAELSPDPSAVPLYHPFEQMVATTPEGYRCDPLQPTPVLYLGSCDMSGAIAEPGMDWASLLYKYHVAARGDFPFIAMSRLVTGCDAILRRLNAFCQKYGAPEEVYVVLPRVSVQEVTIDGGRVLSVCERVRYANWLHRHGIIDERSKDKATKYMEFARSVRDDGEYQLYHLEHFAMVMSLLQKVYGFKFYWTPNLSSTAIDYYAKWMELFLSNNEFMLRTCVGVGHAVDFTFDGSAGMGSQANMAALFNSADLVLDRSASTIAQVCRRNMELLWSHAELFKKITADAGEDRER